MVCSCLNSYNCGTELVGYFLCRGENHSSPSSSDSSPLPGTPSMRSFLYLLAQCSYYIGVSSDSTETTVGAMHLPRPVHRHAPTPAFFQIKPQQKVFYRQPEMYHRTFGTPRPLLSRCSCTCFHWSPWSAETASTVLPKIEYPPKLQSMIEYFHTDMKGTVQFNGNSSDTFEIRSDIKQFKTARPCPSSLLCC